MSHLIATNARSKRSYRCDSVTLSRGDRDLAYLMKVAERLNKHNPSNFVFEVCISGNQPFSAAAHEAAMNADYLATTRGVPEVRFE